MILQKQLSFSEGCVKKNVLIADFNAIVTEFFVEGL